MTVSKKYSLVLCLLVCGLVSTDSFAFGLGSLKSMTNSSVSTSGGSVSNVGPSADAKTQEIVDYLGKRFKVSGDMFKGTWAEVNSYMKAKYGNPTERNGNIYADWILPVGSNCAKVRISFDGHSMNITRGSEPCSMGR